MLIFNFLKNIIFKLFKYFNYFLNKFLKYYF